MPLMFAGPVELNLPNEIVYPLIAIIIVSYIVVVLVYSLVVASLAKKVSEKYYPKSSINRAFRKNGSKQFTNILFFTSAIVGVVFVKYLYHQYFEGTDSGIVLFVVSAIVVSITLATPLFIFTSKNKY